MSSVTDEVSGPFWQGLAERRLMLQFDTATGRAQFYPRPLGLYGEKGVQWRAASGRGSVFALTLSRVAPPALASLAPYPLALVRLEEGPRMLARIQADWSALRPGQAVMVDWDATLAQKPPFPVFRLAD